MSITGFLRSHWHRAARRWTLSRLRNSVPRLTIDKSTWDQSLVDPTGYYMECLRHYVQKLPPDLQQHREYFFNGGRGFGEHAFHVMWDMLLREFKPADFLEIGVFRGQVISLVSLWSRMNAVPCDIWAISPFSGAQDSVSNFPQNIDYWNDTLRNFDHFGLPHPNLVRAFSSDAEALRVIASRQWEMIYIDGNHDLDVVRKDWQACSSNVKRGGVIIMDDAALGTSYLPPCYATAGLPGPSQVAKELDRARFREILHVGHNRVFQRVS